LLKLLPEICHNNELLLFIGLSRTGNKVVSLSFLGGLNAEHTKTENRIPVKVKILIGYFFIIGLK
jgi:hypothetical protein